jgi:hypothetical protein
VRRLALARRLICSRHDLPLEALTPRRSFGRNRACLTPGATA